jgi:putative phosphoserine phosphatase/1-acylglycerol-3-phosphate O-acyltransferase
MHETVVFWDIDGTLLAGSLERYFFSDLLRHRRVTLAQVAGRMFRLTLGSGLPAWYKIKLGYLAGQKTESVRDWVCESWEKSIQPRLYPGAIKAIEIFASAGMRQVLLSGTPRFLAEPLARYLKVDEYIVADPEIQNGSFTGRLVRPHPQGERKADFAGEWLRTRGREVTRVIALANHWQDRFLLAGADRAIAVNPDDRLRLYAQREGWALAEAKSLPGVVQDIIRA